MGRRNTYKRDDTNGSVTTTGTFESFNTWGFEKGSLSIEYSASAGNDAQVKVFGSNFPPSKRNNGEGEEIGTGATVSGGGQDHISWTAGPYQWVYFEIVTLQNDAQVDDWARHMTGSKVEPGGATSS